jgi:hypothetical protein
LAREHTFHAPDVVRMAAVRNPGLEETAVELVAADRIAGRVLRGEIDHALVVAALYWWELHRRRGDGS